MTLIHAAAAFLTALLFLYLFVALLKPEFFP
jgi:K+-transporting ATPase KdpF subunit